MRTLFLMLLPLQFLTANVMKFECPPGWRYADLKEYPATVKMVIVGKGKATFPPQLILNTEPFDGTLPEYLKIVKAYNESQKTEWKDLGTIKTKCGEGSLSQVDVMTEWGVVSMMHLILLKDKIIYILNASATKEEFPTFYAEFFKSMRSLEYLSQK